MAMPDMETSKDESNVFDPLTAMPAMTYSFGVFD